MSRTGWAAWLAAGAALFASLSLPAAILPGNNAWVRQFVTPELTADDSVAQEFVMTRNGLDAIEFAAVVPLGRGTVDVQLVEITEHGGPRVVRRTMLNVADAVRYRFAFDPIADSINRRYRFEVTVPDGESRIALRATKGDFYERGDMRFNGRIRWADLVFRASTPTTTVWNAMWTGRTPSGVQGRIVLALLILNWMAVGALLRLLPA